MRYEQDAGNPFIDGADTRPLKRARRARASAKDEFERPVAFNRTKNTVGHYTSVVMQRGVPFHSANELAGMQWFDLQPIVSKLWPQPRTFEYEIDGETRQYTPDIGLILSDGSWHMIEVKPRAYAELEENRRRWPCIASALRGRKIGFAFLYEDFLKSVPLCDHLRAMQRFRVDAFSSLRVFALLNDLDARQSSTIQDVLPVLQDHGFESDDLFALVSQRHLYVDLTKPLSMTSRVWNACRAPLPAIWEDYHAA